VESRICCTGFRYRCIRATSEIKTIDALVLRAVPFQPKHSHRIATEDFFLVGLRQVFHLFDYIDGSWPRSDGVAMIEIAADDDVVVGPAVDRVGKIRFP
jgi:hypothetical protein